VTQTSFERRYL